MANRTHIATDERKDPPLIVKATYHKLSECPIPLISNQQQAQQTRPDISTLTEEIRVMTVSTSIQDPKSSKEAGPTLPSKEISEKVNYYQGPGRSVLMLMRHPCRLQFCGYLNVTILHGHVYIFGNNLSLTSKKRSLTIFGSKMFHSILIETKESHSTDSTMLKGFVTSQMEFLSSEILSNFRPDDAVILVQELELPKLFLSKLYVPADLHPMSEPHTIFPKISKWLDCNIDEADGTTYHCLQPPSAWENLPLSDRMMVVGGGGLGKSTLSKFLINRLLETHDRVLYFELDIGQGDHLAPGTIGLVIVDEPIIGPHYLKFSKIERMIHLGEVDVMKCFQSYLKSAAYLCKVASKNYSGLPLVVNTMGFSSGQGYLLALKLIRIIKPKTLIQIESLNMPKKNFRNHFTPEVVMENEPIHFDLHVIPSLEKETLITKTFGSKRNRRNLKLLGSWSSMLRPPHYSFNSVQPYNCRFSSLMIGIKDSIAPEDILRALNGCIVALCEEPYPSAKILMSTDKDFFKLVLKPQFQVCLGLGLVRGINADKRELFLLTPLTVDKMQKVKMLVISNVETPGEIFLNQRVVGQVPYVVHNKNVEANAPIIRMHRSPKASHHVPQ